MSEQAEKILAETDKLQVIKPGTVGYIVTISAIDAALAEANQRAEDNRRDAERLDFLSNPACVYYIQVNRQPDGELLFSVGSVATLRDSIDQAIEQGNGGDDA
jgi:hypothetical protein